MLNSKPISTPLPSNHSYLTDTGNEIDEPSTYRIIVGSLQYLQFTRPDLSFAVNRMAQFMHRPTHHHWQLLKRILRYLKGTISHGLLLNSNSQASTSLIAYSDADWAGDRDDRKSTSAFLIYFNGNLISWKSSKQKTVARSSTEAEYRAIANTASELTWIQHLLTELNIKLQQPPTVHCDNVGATYVSVNPALHSKMKHVSIDFHFVRDKVNAGLLRVKHIPSQDQLADLLTKSFLDSDSQP